MQEREKTFYVSSNIYDNKEVNTNLCSQSQRVKTKGYILQERSREFERGGGEREQARQFQILNDPLEKLDYP